MALVNVDFFSQSLMRTVSFQAIVPVDKIVDGQRQSQMQYKTLYLLHGIFGNCHDWNNGTRILRWAQDHNLVVIMPSGENKFYVDNEKTLEYHSRFIGEELVEITRSKLPLSHRREDTFIAGLSMGGYGAIVNGLKYHETFGYIAGLSSALILDKAILSKDGEDVPYLDRRSYMESVFGDLTQLKGSDKDYKSLILKLKKENQEIPRIYLACGTEDFLIKENRDYRDFLLNHDVECTYEEAPGEHNWIFWDTFIYKVLDWLPLDDVQIALSSGHVK